jgi:alkyl sulfatase BDS1-like metallo-beta-lactamase superfamily hydrolase
VVVDDVHRFTLGGVDFEVYATPGGEGPDAVTVWIPQWKVLIAGDALGPTVASFPNLFTLRGENLREPIPMLDSIERMRALRPEILLPGHFEPMRGANEIDRTLGRTSAAIRYVVDATVAGMNEGRDLWTLMREIELPSELAVSQQYGRVPWGVRAIYELHTGWFRYESTTELFEVPARAIYPELAELSGGPTVLAERAAARVEAGEPLEGLHLAEVALAADPDHPGALRAQLAALERLAEERGRGNFQLEGWLRHRIGAVKARLEAAR